MSKSVTPDNQQILFMALGRSKNPGEGGNPRLFEGEGYASIPAKRRQLSLDPTLGSDGPAIDRFFHIYLCMYVSVPYM
jgi:hypothetical protein